MGYSMRLEITPVSSMNEFSLVGLVFIRVFVPFSWTVFTLVCFTLLCYLIVEQHSCSNGLDFLK